MGRIGSAMRWVRNASGLKSLHILVLKENINSLTEKKVYP